LTNRHLDLSSQNASHLNGNALNGGLKELELTPDYEPSPSPTPSLAFVFATQSPLPSFGPCGHLLCGPNGYCDPSLNPPQCSCIGGYSGDNCQTPPYTTN
jgi:hypothetical protein